MSELKLSEYIKSKKWGTVMKLAVAFILSFALLFVGVVAVSSYSKTADVSTIVMTTDDGEYFNANKGGKVSMNGQKVGASKTQTLRQGQSITLTAEANDGYSFVGYFDSTDKNAKPLSTENTYVHSAEEEGKIYANFAKNFELEFQLDNPFDEFGERIIFKQTFYVGQEIDVKEVISQNEDIDENVAQYYENSIPELSQEVQATTQFSFSKNKIVVGSDDAIIAIKPTEPTSLGFSKDSSGRYQITSAADLNALSNYINAANLSYINASFIVTKDITVSSFRPIGGYNKTTSISYPFSGTFDGNNKTITITSIVDESLDYVALIGHNAGTIKNVNVAGTITGTNYVGSVCGYNAGTITNCHSTAVVSGKGSYVGGIVGVNNATLDNAHHVTGAVNGVNTTFGLAVGGVVGINLTNGLVTNVYNTGGVTAANYQWVGGVFGQNHGTVYNVFNKGQVSGAYYVGGLIGQAGGGTLITGYNSGTVVATNTYAGGVVGFNNGGTFRYAYYASGQVRAGGTSGTVQKGEGSATTSSPNADEKYIMIPFNASTGTLASSITMHGETTSSLSRAMNLAWMYIDSKFALSGNYGTSNKFFAWSSETLPTLLTTRYLMAWSTTTAGTSSSTYWGIDTADRLRYLALMVNSGHNYSKRYFRLTANIALGGSATPWNPIGTYVDEFSESMPFSGDFNGQGKTISGMYVSSTTHDYLGLFGYNTGTVYNFYLTSGTVKGTNYIGAACGYNTGVIRTAYNYSVTVEGTGSYIGGLVGVNSGRVDTSYNYNKSSPGTKNTVTGSNTTFGLAVGGIIGINLTGGNVYNVFSTATVTANNYQWVGGLIGQNHGILKNSFCTGQTTGSYYVGGLVGQLGGGSITNAYSSGVTTSKNTYAGGVVGHNNGGTLLYTYYLQDYAKDNGGGTSGTPQKGVGSGTLGSTTADVKDNTEPFNSTTNSSSETRLDITTNYGRLVNTVTISGYKTNVLLDALNYGHSYIAKTSALPSTAYYSWGANTSYFGGFPTIFYDSFGNAGGTAWAGYDSTSGDGSTAAKAFIIKTEAHLRNLANNVNAGTSYTGKYFKLGANITLTKPFRSIGWYSEVLSENRYFNGNLDGQGYTISNLTVNQTTNNNDDYMGLFGYIYSGAVVKNLNVSGTVTGVNYVGGIAGYNMGTLESVTFTGTVNGDGSYIGGIVGVNSGKIKNAMNSAAVNAKNQTFGLAVGGIVGINLTGADTYNLVNSGTVTARNYQWVGGLVGQNHASIKNSFSTGDVTGSYYVGGLVGQLGGGSITNAYSKGKITGANTYVGGVVGYNNGGTLLYTYYLEGSATDNDGNGTAQKGIGSATLGSTTADSGSQTVSFTGTKNTSSITRTDVTTNYGKIAREFVLSGYTTTVLLDALNFGQNYLAKGSSTPSSEYYVWGANTAYYGGYPSFYDTGFTGLGGGTIWSGYSSGTGTSSSPFIIATETDLRNLAFNVNAGTPYTGVYFKVSQNIALTQAFRSIGWYNTTSSESNYFNGILDGNNKTISNLTNNTTTNHYDDYLGLFGYVYSGATIKNLNVSGTVTGVNYVGGVVGYNMGTLQDISFSGTVNGSGSYIGGVVGVNSGKMKSIINKAAVNATNTTFGLAVGGVLGINLTSGNLLNFVNSGAVTALNYQWVGGLVGQNHGTLKNAFSVGAVEGSYYVGGVVGQNGGGTIINTYSSGVIEGTNTYVGGVVGHNNGGDVRFCYYYQNRATDGKGTAQKAVGSGTLGGTTADVAGSLGAFTDTANTASITRPDITSYKGRLTSTITLSGYTTNSLLDALNLGHSYISKTSTVPSTEYYAWGANSSYFGGFPTIYYSSFGAGSGSAWSGYDSSSGNGSSWAQAYIIKTEQHLRSLAFNVNAGTNYTGKYFKIAANISLTQAFRSIGWYNSSTSESNYFNGNLDGQNYTVSNLTVNTTTNNGNTYMGLFGYIYTNGLVKNLKVSGSVTGGTNYIGGIAGYNMGTLETVEYSGSVSGTGSYIGGIAGVNSGKIKNAYNKATVTASNSTFGLAVGGIVGINLTSGNIYNLISTGTVSATNYQWVGGIAGQNHGTIMNSFNSANIGGSYYVGGIVGQNGGGTIINTYSRTASDGGISATNTYVGGIAGSNQGGSIRFSYYLEKSAKDKTTYQKGIGSGTLGGTTADTAGQTNVFTATKNTESFTRPDVTDNYGRLSSSVSINGYATNVLLDALNFGQSYISKTASLPSTEYLAWGANTSYFSGYPTIYYTSFSTGDMSTSWTGYASGTGTSADPFVIKTETHLRNLAFNVNSGTTYTGKYFVLGNDITLTKPFRSIGWYNTETSENNYFNASFDGRGYKISGLNITSTSNSGSDYMGLFGYVYSGAVIKNVTVSGTVSGGKYVGGIAGYNMGKMDYVIYEGSVTGDGSYIGGVIGVNSGTLNFVSNKGSVSGTNSTFGLAVGGIAGINLTAGTIRNCFNDGVTVSTTKVEANNYQWVGGIAGQNHGNIINSYTNMAVKGAYYVGGVAGQNGGGTIQNVYNRGTVTGTNTYVGGVLGSNNGGTMQFGYYLQNCATDNNGSGVKQNGLGSATLGARTADTVGTTNAFNTSKVLYTINASGTASAATVYNTTNLLTALQNWAGANASNVTWENGPDNYPALITAIPHTLTISNNGVGTIAASSSWTGSGSSVTKTIFNGMAIGALPDETQITAPTGYEFGVWYKESACTNKVTEATTFTGDAIIYADWITKSFTVTVGKNFGGISATPTTVMFGSAFTITLTKPSKTGYEYTLSSLKVYKGSSANNANLIESISVSTALTYTYTLSTYSTSIYVYATWTERAISTIATFNANGGSVSEVNRGVTYDQTYNKLMNIYPSDSTSNFSSLTSGRITLASNVFTVNYTNSTTSTQYVNFMTKTNTSKQPIVVGATYTYVLEVLTWTGDALTFNIGKTASSAAQLSKTSKSISAAGTHYLTLTAPSE
ncbi:MAG: hypothetical protein IJF22_00845, partial [Clostridia bacterium]|nr:hypothetical protein [Clostridia bacterium]